jgi:hypothetical protein
VSCGNNYSSSSTKKSGTSNCGGRRTSPASSCSSSASATATATATAEALGAILHRAVLVGADQAERALKMGAKANGRIQGHHVLHLAAANGDEDTVRLLLRCGSHVNVTNALGWSPLHYAVLAGHAAICELLLSKNAWPCSRDNMHFTPMHVLSTRAADTATLRKICGLLLESGGMPSLEAKDAHGNTPLHIAASCGNTNMCLVLLEHGVSVEERNMAKKKAGAWWQAGIPDVLKNEVLHVLRTGRRSTSVLRPQTPSAAPSIPIGLTRAC